MNGHLTIVSCGLGPDDITPRHRRAIASAELLAGGQRLLDWFPESTAERVTIGAHASETARELAAKSATKQIVVLASGDALFFGIARLFAAHLQSTDYTILPNITAAQAALAKLRTPWQNAHFFSVHGRNKPLPWCLILRSATAVIYCDSIRTPASVAQELITRHADAASRPAAIAAHLGAEKEQLHQGTLAALAALDVGGMSMLILLPVESSHSVPSLPLGLDDDYYVHENGLITHPEVRAVVLSKLHLRAGVLWDLGAGSGSVSVEAASLCEGLVVYAVERKAERCEQIRNNAERWGCTDYTVVEANAREALDQLPPPDSVFIGGGGKDLEQIANAAFRALRPGGTLTVTAVMEETRATLLRLLPEHRQSLIELTIRRGGALGSGTLLRPENPVAIFTFRKASHP